MTNAQRRQEVSATQAAVDEAQSFIHDVMNKVINPSDMVIAYREVGGGFGMYSAVNDPLIASGMLSIAGAAIARQASMDAKERAEV